MGNPDIDKINRLFKTLTARKISVISRLAGLNAEEIEIMRLRWLEGKSDIQICDILGMSTATLVRKRRQGYVKVADALELYGLSDLETLPASEILDYEGRFYLAQDELIRFFIRHKSEEKAQDNLLVLLRMLNGRD